MANSKCTKQIREDRSGIDFTFSNGEVISANLQSFSESIQLDLMIHGLSQKGGDSYSGLKTVEEAMEALRDTIDRLIRGDWKSVREGGGGARVTDLVEALAAATTHTVEECRPIVGDMDKDAKADLRKHPKVAVELARIKATREQEKLAALQVEAADAPDLDF